MASVNENEPDSTVYESRVSYLMLLEGKQTALKKKALLHRLFCISKLASEDTDKAELSNYYEDLFKKLQDDHQAEAISGILLVYPNHVVHLIEAAENVIFDIIRDLDETKPGSNPLLTGTKILTINHDIPTRLYQLWSSRILNISTAGVTEYEGKDGVNELVIEAVTSMLKLGMFLLKSPKLNVKNAMENLHDTVPELLIPQDQIAFMLKSGELDSPKQYLKTYCSPCASVLDNELVWPLPSDITINI